MYFSYPDAASLFEKFTHTRFMALPADGAVKEYPLVRRPDTELVMYQEGRLTRLCLAVDYLALASHIGALMGAWGIHKVLGGSLAKHSSILSREIDGGRDLTSSDELFEALTDPSHEGVFTWGRCYAWGYFPVKGAPGLPKARSQFDSMYAYEFFTSEHHATALSGDFDSLKLRLGDVASFLRARGMIHEHQEEALRLVDFLSNGPCALMLMLPEDAAGAGLHSVCAAR